MYTIRYQHGRPAVTAQSLSEANGKVRREMEWVGGRGDQMVTIRCDDGRYCYADRESADADETGANAFAVIESEDESEE